MIGKSKNVKRTVDGFKMFLLHLRLLMDIDMKKELHGK
jgi:hypothetical protein